MQMWEIIRVSKYGLVLAFKKNIHLRHTLRVKYIKLFISRVPTSINTVKLNS